MGCAGSREEKRRSRHHHDTDDVSMSSGTDPLSSVPDRHRRQSRARSANSSPRQRHMDPPRHDAYRVGSVDHTPASVALSQQLAERGSQRSSAGRVPSLQSQRRETSPPRSPIDGNVAQLLDEIDDLKAPSIGDPAEEPTDVMRQATEADIVSRAFAEHGITAAIDQFAASQQSMNVNRKGGQKARTKEWLLAVEASNYGLTPQDPQLSASPNSQLGSPGMRYVRNDATPAPLANFNPASFAMTPEQPSIAGNSTFILHSAVFAMNQSEMTLPGTVADTVSQGSAMSAEEHKMPRQARTRATLGKQPTFVHRMTTSAAQTPAHGGAETPEPDDVTATFRH